MSLNYEIYTFVTRFSRMAATFGVSSAEKESMYIKGHRRINGNLFVLMCIVCYNAYIGSATGIPNDCNNNKMIQRAQSRTTVIYNIISHVLKTHESTFISFPFPTLSVCALPKIPILNEKIRRFRLWKSKTQKSENASG